MTTINEIFEEHIADIREDAIDFEYQKRLEDVSEDEIDELLEEYGVCETREEARAYIIAQRSDIFELCFYDGMLVGYNKDRSTEFSAEDWEAAYE
jgi:hypothetical protein